MITRKLSICLVVILVFFLSSCNLLVAPASQAGPTTDPQILIDQAVQQTMAAQTQPAPGSFTNTLDPQEAIKLAVQQTFAAQTQIAQTVAAAATNTPEFTIAPSLTPTPTFTITLETVRVSVSVETNCRSGPGAVYDKLGVLKVGQAAEAVGRNAANDTWIIKLPSNPSVTCWVWGQYATVTGNWQSLPIINTPPTPTPAASFLLSYSDTQRCPAAYSAINLIITNNGSITWESNHVWITDQDTSETQDISRNDFPRSGVCAIISQDLNLSPGEVGYTYYSLIGIPTGHTVSATVRVCSEDGMGGICLEKTIKFTP